MRPFWYAMKCSKLLQSTTFKELNNMRILTRTFCVAIATSLISLVGSTQAQIFTEADFGGDFSNLNTAPTSLGTLSVGTTVISGISNAGASDRDHVTFTIGTGEELTSLLITEFDPTAGGGSFFGVAAGNIAPAPDVSLLFGDLVNVTSGATPLEILGGTGGGFGPAADVPVTLGPGDYSLLFNETGAVNANYSAQLTVTSSVPEPTSAVVLAGIGMVALRRRRKS